VPRAALTEYEEGLYTEFLSVGMKLLVGRSFRCFHELFGARFRNLLAIGDVPAFGLNTIGTIGI
jgi:hypothetical protein